MSRNTSGRDEHFFGFGLQFHSLDQRGRQRTMKTNADPPEDNGMAHAPDPFFYSTRGYGIFLNSAGYSHFDMCATTQDAYTFSAPEATLDYFFIYGPSFREISDRQTWLRGRIQMPPKWGLGFWYRMPTKWKGDLTTQTAKEFRERRIPCDVIGLEPGWQSGGLSLHLCLEQGLLSRPCCLREMDARQRVPHQPVGARVGARQLSHLQ